MLKSENKVERLAFLLGGKRKLAHACEVSPSLVTRWCRKGWVDPAYNIRIERAIAAHMAGSNAKEEFAREALSCLETEDICRCCGRPLPKGRVL